jgi:PAS domain S-box-containing protein
VTSEGRAPEPLARSWVTVGFALIGLAALAAVAWLAVHLRFEERSRTVSSWQVRLEGLADGRKRAVQTWLAERRSDAEVLAWDPNLIDLCAVGTCPKGIDPQVLQAHLDNLLRFAGFLGAYFFDPAGDLLLSAEGAVPLGSRAAVAVRRAAREGRYLLHDLHHADDGTPMVGFLAPVFGRAGAQEGPEDGSALGVAGLYLDPRGTLFPVVGGPEPWGATSVEAYLVRRTPEGAEILSPVRGSAPGRPPVISFAELNSAEVAALESKETLGWFHDYRGGRVLAALRWISEAGWGLVVKVDEEEVLAAWRRAMAWEASFLGAALLCLALAAVAAQRTWAGRRYRLLLEELRDREERLRALALGSDDVVFIKDAEGRFVLANAAAARVLGVGVDEAVGRRSEDLLPPHVAEVLQAHDRQVLATGRSYQGEESIPVGGGERTFLASRIPLHDGQGRVTGVAGILRDITERKQSERALARWAQTLGALYRLGRNLTLAGSADAALQSVLDGAVQALGAEAAAVYLADAAAGALILADSRGLPPEARAMYARVPFGHGLAGRVFSSGEVALFDHEPSPSEAAPESAFAPRAVALAAVPLRAEGQVLGVLTLGFHRPRRFLPDERDALQVLGHMAGVALERARARESLEAEARQRRRAEERLRRLHDATAGLTGQDLFAAVVRAVQQELGTRWALLSRIEEGVRAVPLAALDREVQVQVPPYRLEGTPCADVIATRELVFVPQGAAALYPEDAALGEMGAESYAGVPLLDSRGEPVGILCCLHDEPMALAEHGRDVLGLYARRAAGEVERLFAERRLAETQRTLETLIRNLPGAVYRCGFRPERPVVYVSAGSRAVTGHPPEVFSGAGAPALTDLVVPEDRPRVWRAIQKAVTAGRSYEVEYRIHDASGTVRWVYDVGRGVHGAAGETEALEGVLFDHTERRSLETRLTHGQRMEALGRLAGGVAHDFNNLLTAISGYAEMLAARLPEGDRERRAAREILRASDRAADLTRQLLAFSRRQVMESRVFDLSEAVGATARMLGRLLGDDIELVVDLDPRAGTVRLDPGQLEQVVLNLAVNARDAMPQGGRLTLRTYPAPEPAPGRLPEGGPAGATGALAVLEVSDTGAGLSPEVLEHIFEPFFTTKAPEKGTGLGLASVYGIVQQAGGRVEVVSEPGAGTTFRAFWPRWAGKPDQEPAREGAGMVRARGETVLLVEDEDAVREAAAEHLASQGYRVLSCASGAEALQRLNAPGPVDVLVSDVVMPGMSGPELVRRARVERPNLPVILVSGHTGEALAGGDLEGPRDAFLPKPFRLVELGRALDKVLGRSQPPTSDG